MFLSTLSMESLANNPTINKFNNTSNANLFVIFNFSMIICFCTKQVTMVIFNECISFYCKGQEKIDTGSVLPLDGSTEPVYLILVKISTCKVYVFYRVQNTMSRKGNLFFLRLFPDNRIKLSCFFHKRAMSRIFKCKELFRWCF